MRATISTLLFALSITVALPAAAGPIKTDKYDNQARDDDGDHDRDDDWDDNDNEEAFRRWWNRATPLTSLALCSEVTNLDNPCRVSGKDVGGGRGEKGANVEDIILGITGEKVDLTLMSKFSGTGGAYSYSFSFPEPLRFVTVKAGNEFKLYDFGPGVTSGTVDSSGLVNNPHTAYHAISHISFWSGGLFVPTPEAPTIPSHAIEVIPDMTDVPEPAALGLFALGIVGVAAVRRKVAPAG